MGRRCIGREGDPHRWVNGSFMLVVQAAASLMWMLAYRQAGGLG